MNEARTLAFLRLPDGVETVPAQNSQKSLPVNGELGSPTEGRPSSASKRSENESKGDVKLDPKESKAVEKVVKVAMKKALQLLTGLPGAVFTGIFMVFESPRDSGKREDSEFMSDADREYAKAKVQFAEAYKAQQRMASRAAAAAAAAGGERDHPDGPREANAGNRDHVDRSADVRAPEAKEAKTAEAKAPEAKAPEARASDKGRSVDVPMRP